MNTETANKLNNDPVWKAHLAGKPILKLSKPDGIWYPCDSPSADEMANYPARFRVTPEYLQPGWRIREPGETIQKEDIMVWLDGTAHKVIAMDGHVVTYSGNTKIYTKEPIPANLPDPPDGMKWHNPRNLDARQVEVDKGYRLLLVDERIPDDAEFFGIPDGWNKSSCCGGLACGDTYRTKKPLPKKGKMLPLEEKDLSIGVWFKTSSGERLACIGIYNNGVVVMNKFGERVLPWFITWGELYTGGMLYSYDGKDWMKCQKEEEV